MVENPHLGKWMSWDEIVRIYPNRWVLLTNYKKMKETVWLGESLKLCARIRKWIS